MIRKGRRNLITDIEGLMVGQAEDEPVRTGVSALICAAPFPAAVDVRGGAPGSRELDALDPCNLVGEVDAIVLSGGSAFGLDAASGVVDVLRREGRGFLVAPEAPAVPIVPAAILFDLTNGGNKAWAEPPYANLGRRAAHAAAADFKLGRAGAGYGATAGVHPGGIGSASAVLDEAYTVGALAAVNAVGSPYMPGCDALWAWPFEIDGEFGGVRPPLDWRMADADLPADMKGARPGANTTISVIATDADLSRVELKRLAVMAADGFARAIRPSHSPFDGDIVFALATGQRPLAGGRELALLQLGAAAADVMARAIARGVHEAGKS